MIESLAVTFSISTPATRVRPSSPIWRQADGLPSDTFDCFILTQTLQYIYRADAAIRHAHRVLQPGGVLLATVPAVSRVAYPPEVAPDYWRFTAAACSKLFGEAFGPDQVTVRAHGNVLTCIAFLAGMALEELKRAELDADDPLFPTDRDRLCRQAPSSSRSVSNDANHLGRDPNPQPT